VSGKARATLATAALAAGALVLVYQAVRWRNEPSVELPRPLLTRSRLRQILVPKPGDRVLEVGPGTGYYALHTARWLSAGGTLDVLDIRQEMLGHTMRRARERDITNVVPTLGDARELPYPDDAFDAAYLVVVLGEVPDQGHALEELRRVLKPDGRLVIGEWLIDPHMVRFGTLRARAEAAGFNFERRLGGDPAYFASFRSQW
jgi:ubiquinone/menaquinone biosynthesis C-methylase UbiE